MESVSALAAVSLAATQIAKKLGIQGNYLIIVCIVVGGLGNFLMTYYPAAWDALSGILIGTTTTGGVSFLHDLLAKAKPSEGA